MALGDDQVISDYNFSDENEEVNSVESIILIMHGSLKESVAKNKELNAKIMSLIDENVKLFQEHQKLKQKKC